METLQYFLPQVWFVILALFLFLYVMLDGFDLGVGILSLTSSDEERRGILMTSLSLSGGGWSEFPGNYDYFYRVSDSGDVVLQPLPVHCVSR